jgi:hypothetical protein
MYTLKREKDPIQLAIALIQGRRKFGILLRLQHGPPVSANFAGFFRVRRKRY